jgi:hypothetical protein
MRPAHLGKCLQMSKEELERYLAEGPSLEQIGKQVGHDPSTVSYHFQKHGLVPVGHGVHAPKPEDRSGSNGSQNRRSLWLRLLHGSLLAQEARY